MHKIKRKNQKNKLKFVVIISFLLVSVLIIPAYAYMRQQLGVEGKTMILDTTENKLCDGSVTYEIYSWPNGDLNYYKLSFKITNNSDNDYNFWDVYFDVPADAELHTYSSTEAERIGNKIKASNVVYNGNIKAGESTTFEVQLTTNKTDYEPTTITLNNCTTTSSDDDSNNDSNDSNNDSNVESGDNDIQENEKIDIEFKVVGSYGNYTYQYDVTINNNSTDRIEGWGFKIKKPENTKLTNAWNANYIIKEEEIEFSDAGYNNVIEPGQSVMFGMIIETDIYGYMPELINE